METTSLISLSRAAALERKVAVIANNIANVGTTAYKAQEPLFTEFLFEPEDMTSVNETYKMILDQGTSRDLSAGPITQTGNPLDVALEGDGYLQVETLDGMRYTRAGNLSMDSSRVLVTSSGLPVLDDTGNQITFPNNIQHIMIAEDGTVSTDAGTLATLGLYRFDEEQKMDTLGSGLLSTTETPKVAEDTKVRQGFLEQSNVQAVAEMTQMVEVSRQYQSVQKLLQNQHDLLRKAYQSLSKITSG